MEPSRNEVEFDEFEKLLGEIPSAMSGNTNSEESGPKRLSLNGNLSHICVNSHEERPFIEKVQNNGSFEEGKISTSKVVNHLPDYQSFTSAFAELSFNKEATFDNGKTCKSAIKNHPVFGDVQYPNMLKKKVPNINHYDQPDLVNFLPENSTFKLDAEEFKKGQFGHCPPIENFDHPVHLAHAVQGFQYLSTNVPIQPSMQFPLICHQAPVFLNPPGWENMDEEQYYRMHEQIFLQFRDHTVGMHHPVQENGNVMSRNRQQYIDQLNPEFLWKNCGIPPMGSSHQSNLAVSCDGLNEMQNVGKGVKQCFPEKILTRSHGLNTLKPTKFGSVEGNESMYHLNRNGKVFSADHICHNSFNIPNDGCFQLEDLSSPGLFADSMDLRTTDLKLMSQKYNSVDEVTGRIYIMAKDQHGCRFLQRKFAEGSSKDVDMIFIEIIDHIVELMTDPFGNYLVQKLLEVCDEDQRMQILRAITRTRGELVRISCDMHGTRAVQKVIETLRTPEQLSLVVSSLEPGIVTLVKNINGNHVAQRCLQYLMPEYIAFLFEAATNNCVELATDRHGCCVLQKCLSHSDGELRCRLICEITSNALVLSQDQFGNYVVQFVFDLKLPWATVEILDQLESNYADLSVQKYSSNVVEKCLKYAGEDRRTGIIHELIENPRLDQIMQDPYGNYVIQAALNQSKGALHAKLVDAIRLHVPVLRSSPYGKKILSSNTLKK